MRHVLFEANINSLSVSNKEFWSSNQSFLLIFSKCLRERISMEFSVNACALHQWKCIIVSWRKFRKLTGSTIVKFCEETHWFMKIFFQVLLRWWLSTFADYCQFTPACALKWILADQTAVEVSKNRPDTGGQSNLQKPAGNEVFWTPNLSFDRKE